MAPGIYKTFRKAWNNNVKKAIEFRLINSDINYIKLLLEMVGEKYETE